jgi:hypothetical protein
VSWKQISQIYYEKQYKRNISDYEMKPYASFINVTEILICYQS